ncbi:MAG: hypothetical protein JNL67_06980 [Planctomycetaceae bacterium]|nr:hypothetical protein [Planctomycetaceae bacterium]
MSKELETSDRAIIARRETTFQVLTIFGTLPVDTGQELRTFKGHSEFAYAVNFSPDGRRLVSGSRDATVKLWDIQTGREELTLSGNAGEVHLVCFSPDGMKVVSASVDGKLILWDAQTGQKLISIPAHTEYVDSVRFNADGTEIISITFSGSEEFVWDAATGSHLGNKPRQFRNSSNCLSSDGKYYLLPAFDHVKLVNLSFKNSKNELAFRTAKASFNRQWHSKKAMNAELEKDWRTALFHWAWVVDSNWNANKIIEPTYDVAIDRLKLAYRKWLSEHSITDRRSSAMLSSSQLHSKVRHVLNAVLSSPRLMPPGTAASEIDN